MVRQTRFHALSSDAVIEKYSIFSKEVTYTDPETSKPKTETKIPTAWNTNPDPTQGTKYKQDEVIECIEHNYDLYAVWPEEYVWLIYDIFNGDRTHRYKLPKKYVETSVTASVLDLAEVVDVEALGIQGFKGWLDENDNLLSPGKLLQLSDNYDLRLSCAWNLVLTYDLNGGSLLGGQSAAPQRSMYQKHVGKDFKDYDVKAEIVLTADNPQKTGVDFGGWKVNGTTFSTGDKVSIDEDVTATAVWLYDPTYSFYTFKSPETFGQIDYGERSSDGRTQVFTAKPSDGFLFSKWKIVTFDGTKSTTAYDSSSTAIRVELPAAERKEVPVNVYANVTAYFKYDGTWTRVTYDTGSSTMFNVNGTATTASLGINDSNRRNIVRVEFAPLVVTGLAEALFKDCTQLTAVVIPSSVTSYGKSLFENCTALKLVDFS